MQWGRILLLTFVAAVYGCANQGYAPVDHRGESPPRAIRSPASNGAHRVQWGETLYSIAFQYGLNDQDLAAWNGVRAPRYLIRSGQTLRLTAPPSTAGAAEAPAAKKRKAEPAKSAVQPAAKTTQGTKAKANSHAKARNAAAPNWTWPTAGRVSKPFSRRVGVKKGIEINGRAGQQIKAAAAGRVVYAGSGLVGYGKLIIVKHNETYLSAYGHNNKLLAQEGERVRKGQMIAEMGSTSAKRPMLHFEIRKRGQPVDPLRYLPKR